MLTFYELMEEVFRLEKSGKKIIRLDIGDTNLPTPSCATAAAIKMLHEKKSSYGPAAGLPELREMIAEREECKIENVVVGPGSKHLIYALMSVIGKRGRVVFPSPHWPAYELAARQLGLRAVAARTSLENNWQFESLPLQGATIAIICNPLNPTSTVYPSSLIWDTIEEAGKKKVHVVLDEAYKGLSFKHIPKYDAIRIRSFSKEFNMEGWRLGYVVAPVAVAKRIVAFNHITATCTPAFVQQAGIACLNNEKEILSHNKKIWKNRMLVAKKLLKAAGFRFAIPQSGIYVFVTHDSIGDASEYALKLLNRGVAVAPGNGFGDYKSFVRICLNQPKDILVKGIKKMAEF